MDVIGTKVQRVFLLAIYSCLLTDFIPLPPSLEQKRFETLCNVNIVYGNLKSENSQNYAQKPQRFVRSLIRLLYFRMGRELQPSPRPQTPPETDVLFFWTQKKWWRRHRALHSSNNKFLGCRGDTHSKYLVIYAG